LIHLTTIMSSSKVLMSARQSQERRNSEESSRWIGIIDKLRSHSEWKNGEENSHPRHVSINFHDTDFSSEATSPTSLVEAMSGELECLRQRLESVETTKLEFVTLCSHLEDEIEKSQCLSLTEIQQMRVQNQALLEENTRLAEEYQQLKRSNARLIDDYSKRELEYMNHMNQAEKSLRQTGVYYESKISHQNELIASLYNEVKRLRSLTGMTYTECMETKVDDASDMTNDTLIPTLVLSQPGQSTEELAVAGARVPLLEKKLSEAEQTIAQLRDEVQKLVDQRLMDSDLSWLELQACGKSLHDHKGISTTV